MPVVSPKKKTSLVISAISFLLGLAIGVLFICGLYFKDNTVFDYNGIVNSFKNYLGTLQLHIGSTYIVLLAAFGPALFTLLALILGRAARWTNIFAFTSMLTTIVYYVSLTSQTRLIFDFSSPELTFYSYALIVAIVGLILTFINLEKSK